MVICPVKDYAALFCLQYTLTENSWFHVCSIVVYNSGGANLKTQDGLTIFFATQHINYQLKNSRYYNLLLVHIGHTLSNGHKITNNIFFLHNQENISLN
jgi:hypothetical protein